MKESIRIKEGRSPTLNIIFLSSDFFFPLLDCGYLNAAAAIKTHQCSQCFPVFCCHTVVSQCHLQPSVSCSKLTGMTPAVFFCCRGPSAFSFCVLCIRLQIFVITSSHFSHCCLSGLPTKCGLSHPRF